METKTNLNESTVEVLQDLVQVNVDSRKGLQEVAEKTDDATVRTMFEKVAAERDRQASEIAALLQTNGKEPNDDGSLAASAHRTLIDIRAALGGDTTTMLVEAEKGEDVIKEKYENALKKEPASAVSDLLHRHYADVKAAHDRIRDTRDQFKSR